MSQNAPRAAHYIAEMDICNGATLLVRIQRAHDPDAWQHGIAAVFGHQHQRLGGRAPFRCVVLTLRQSDDAGGGIAQGGQRAALARLCSDAIRVW